MNAFQHAAMWSVLDEVALERQRQHSLRGEQDLPHGMGGALDLARLRIARAMKQAAIDSGTLTYREICGEEACEVHAATTEEEIEIEAIQAAASYVQLVEAIRRNRAAGKAGAA